jgi:hypothetical protein
MIIQIEESPLKYKRYRVFLDNGKHYDFGYKYGTTYIDGASELTRTNYRKRHLANKTEKERIENLIDSSALFSYYLLWGESRDLIKNIYSLNELMNKK